MLEGSQQSPDIKGDGILNRPACHYYYDDMHVKGNNSCEHPYLERIYNGQSSMIVLESWGEMAQSMVCPLTALPPGGERGRRREMDSTCLKT